MEAKAEARQGSKGRKGRRRRTTGAPGSIPHGHGRPRRWTLCLAVSHKWPAGLCRYFEDAPVFDNLLVGLEFADRLLCTLEFTLHPTLLLLLALLPCVCACRCMQMAAEVADFGRCMRAGRMAGWRAERLEDRMGSRLGAAQNGTCGASSPCLSTSLGTCPYTHAYAHIYVHANAHACTHVC